MFYYFRFPNHPTLSRPGELARTHHHGHKFPRFREGTGKYFGHFSPTLRSITLNGPTGTCRQLLEFFTLFPKLDNIKLTYYFGQPPTHEGHSTQRNAIRGGLRGQLVITNYGAGVGLLEDIIVAFGGMRFSSMELEYVPGMRLLLEAGADTLQTFRWYPDGAFQIWNIILVS